MPNPIKDQDRRGIEDTWVFPFPVMHPYLHDTASFMLECARIDLNRESRVRSSLFFPGMFFFRCSHELIPDNLKHPYWMGQVSVSAL